MTLDSVSPLAFRQYSSLADFKEDCLGYLLQAEVMNNLLLATCLGDHQESDDLFLAALFSDQDPVAAATLVPTRPLLISEAPNVPLDSLVAALRRDGRSPAKLLASTETAMQFTRLWSKECGCTSMLGMGQGVYSLSKVVSRGESPGFMRMAEYSDIPVLAGWVADFMKCDAAEAAERVQVRIARGEVYLWIDRVARSMAAWTRPTVNGVGVNAVYTPPQFRKQGYATACVAALSELLLRQYAFCYLHTDLGNPTSNRIYQRIGYSQVGTMQAITFDYA